MLAELLREIDRTKALVRHALKSESPRYRLAGLRNAHLLRVQVEAVQRISAWSMQDAEDSVQSIRATKNLSSNSFGFSSFKSFAYCIRHPDHEK